MGVWSILVGLFLVDTALKVVKERAHDRLGDRERSDVSSGRNRTGSQCYQIC
jgi:hypothetical protein